MKIDRDGVEQILDLQVSVGRITPQIKEERLREYDAKVQEAIQQQYGVSMSSAISMHISIILQVT